MGGQRQSDQFERLAFANTLRACRMALMMRQVDAREKTHTHLDRYLGELAKNERRVAVLQTWLDKFPHSDGQQMITTAAGDVRVRDLRAQITHHAIRAEEAAVRADAFRALLEEAEKWHLNNQEGPTPETAVKPARRSSLHHLERFGKIDKTVVMAAMEIARIIEALHVCLFFVRKTSWIQAAGRPPKRSGFIVKDLLPDDISEWHHHRYVPWTQAVNRRKHLSLPFVMRIVVDGLSIKAARLEFGYGYPRAIRILKESLELYWAFKRRHEYESTLPRETSPIPMVLNTPTRPKTAVGRAGHDSHAV